MAVRGPAVETDRMPPFSEALAKFVPLVTTGTPLDPHGADPSDLSRYMPQGLGLAGPMVFRPWDRLEDIGTRRDYYGFGARSGDPIRDAPGAEPSGGVVYFDDDIAPADLAVVMRILGVRTRESNFFVVCASAADPPQSRYLDQIRLIELAAFPEVFRFKPDPRPAWPGEPMTIGAVAHLFVELQRERWNDPEYTFSSRLRGTLGGDGDWAKESLAFGFMVENTSWGIHRMWSRPWLVTK